MSMEQTQDSYGNNDDERARRPDASTFHSRPLPPLRLFARPPEAHAAATPRPLRVEFASARKDFLDDDDETDEEGEEQPKQQAPSQTAPVAERAAAADIAADEHDDAEAEDVDMYDPYAAISELPPQMPEVPYTDASPQAEADHAYDYDADMPRPLPLHEPASVRPAPPVNEAFPAANAFEHHETPPAPASQTSPAFVRRAAEATPHASVVTPNTALTSPNNVPQAPDVVQPHDPNRAPTPPFDGHNTPPPSGELFGGRSDWSGANVAPTIVSAPRVERRTIVERDGLLSKAAVLGLIAERHRRIVGDRKAQNTLRRQAEVQTRAAANVERQAQVVQSHESALRQQAANHDSLATNFGQHVAESAQAVKETSSPSRPAEVVHSAPKMPEQAVIVDDKIEQTEEQPTTVRQPEKYVQHSVWHNIIEGADASQYGESFQRERQNETVAHVPQAIGTIGSATAAPSTTAAQQLPGSVSPSLPSGMTTPSLPSGSPSYQDPQHLLPAPEHKVRGAFATLFIWLLVAVFAFAVVSGARLLL